THERAELGIVDRAVRAPGTVTKLRAEMTAREPGASLVDLEAIRRRERLGHAFCNREVRLQVPRERALGRLDQPPSVASEDRWCCGIQVVEQPLDVCKPEGRVMGSFVPQAQAEVLELSQEENGVKGPRICEASVPARPAMTLPVLIRAGDQLQRIEL